MTNNTQSPHRGLRVCAAIGAAALMLAAFCLPFGIAEIAYGASSAEQKAQEYAQQDPGYQSTDGSSGSTQYYLDIEEPEPTPTPIDTDDGSILPKTGDSAESRLLLMGLGGLGVLAIAGLCMAVWPRKRDDEEEEDAWDDEDIFRDDPEDDEQ